MTDKKCISWIFLSLESASQISPADFGQISLIADGINHSVPNEKEIQKSISWLKNQGLIVQMGKKYELSEQGKHLFQVASKGNKTYIETWVNLESKFKELS